MKKIRIEISLLLVIALVVSSLIMGFGQFKAEAYTDAAGTGIFRVDIAIGVNDEYDSDRGTNCSFKLQFLNASGGVVCATPDNAIIGTGSPDPLENGQTTTFTYNGSGGGNVACTVPSLATLAVNKTITQVQLVNTSWVDRWVFNNVVIYYSNNGGTTWVTLANNSWSGSASGTTATWSVGTYFTGNVKTVAFNANGGSPNYTYDAIPGQTITAPATPMRAGYTFAGWSPAVPARMPSANTSYTVQWTANQYTITFDANGGTGGTSQSLACGSTLNPPTVTRDGYTFIAWSPSVSTTVPAVDKTHTAIWLANGESNTNTYNITFSPNGGAEMMPAQSILFGQTAALTNNAFTKTGFTFSGWATSQVIADSGAVEYLNGVNYTITNNVTLYAVWKANVYSITFDAYGGTGGTSNLMITEDPLTAPSVTRTGYTFTGWMPAVPATVPAENTTYRALWTANTYIVSFDAQGGAVSPATKTITYASTYGTLPTPTKTGYIFGGWYTGTGGTGANYLSTTPVTLAPALMLYAKWTAITYTVAYNGSGSTGGSTTSTSHYYNSGQALRANGFTNTGYAFAGWATSADGDVVYSDRQSVINLSSTQGETVTLYAKWTNINVSTVTFDANGGTGGKSTTLIIGSTLTAPTVAKTGYTFVNWSPAIPSTMPAENTTYTAQWTPRIYTVTFNPQSGTVSPTTSTVTYGSTYGAGTGGIPTPIRSNYSFGGWYTGTGGTGTIILSTTAVTITASQTLYAYWIPVISVTITFDTNGGTGGTSSTMTAGDPLTAYTVTKTGYTFIGWSPTVPATVPAANTAYTAQWSINSYTITFNANGGTGGTSDLMVYGSVLTAPAVTKTEYTFNGWSPVISETVPAANTTYTAIWGSDLDFAYTVSNSQATITKYNGTGGNVVIPDTLGGYPVTVIGTNAFRDCNLLTSLTLPASLTTITNWALFGCTNLTDIFVKSGSDSFSSQYGVLFNADKTSLIYYPNNKSGNYTIPDSVNNIAYGAFAYCTGLIGITIPDGVTSIGEAAFYGCSSLNNIIIPGSVVSIGYRAFDNCIGLTGLIIGSGVKTIEGQAFNECSGLTSITIPDSVTTVGYGVFGHCHNLTSVTIGNGLTQIYDSSFSSCTKLTSISIPNTVQTIGNGAFQSCSKLTSVSIPNSVKTIGGGAFQFCDSLASITLPSSITSIDIGAFTRDTMLMSVYFYGDPPVMGNKVFQDCPSGLMIYHLPDKTGFTSPTWNGYTTAVFTPASTITFDANGGTGGSSTSMTYGSALTAPTVTKPGYTFTGWSPAVPTTVPATNTTYTVEWTGNKPSVSITKLALGFKVNIVNCQADYKYQIWSYQEFTDDLFTNNTAKQWILSKAYALGSSGTAEPDGSISFTIADFVSPDGNYTIAVRMMDAGNTFAGEIRDTYTPTDVSEVKIAKVLVDGEYSSGREIREIKTGAAMTFKVIGNDVAGTVFTAKVLESGTTLTANNSSEFNWDFSALTPGTYTVHFIAGNGVTTDIKDITVQLYSLDTGIQYGNISELALTAAQDNVLPRVMAVEPDFTNGTFYYRVGEPGRKAVFTSNLFDPTDNIEYTFTKYGIYQIAGFVNREDEVKIGSYYDDGFIKQFTVNRSQTEPSTATLTATVNDESFSLTEPVAKGTAVQFTASAQIGGIGATPVRYSFWRYDAKGYALVKDWSSDNTLDWTPAKVGNYSIEVRAKGTDAGSYEVAKSVKVTVMDNTDTIAQGVAISLNTAELNLNARARAPITIKAAATSTNSEDLLYKFYVGDAAMGATTLQSYSADSNCIWTPRKAGTYTISVLVKNNASYGAYDAIEKFDITVN